MTTSPTTTAGKSADHTAAAKWHEKWGKHPQPKPASASRSSADFVAEAAKYGPGEHRGVLLGAAHFAAHTEAKAPAPARELSGRELAAQQFTRQPAAPAAKARTPTAELAQRRWNDQLKAKFTPTAAPRTRSEMLDDMGAALAMETAGWIGSAKSQSEIKAAADAYLAREVGSLSAAERSAVAALAAEGVAEMAKAAPAVSVAPVAPRAQVKGKSKFLSLVESGNWFPPGHPKRKAPAAASITPAAITTAGVEPEETVEPALPGHSFPLLSVIAGASGMPSKLSLLQRMKLGAASILGF